MDTEETAHEDEQEETEEQETDQTEQKEEPQRPFTKEQEQFIGSWLGRIVKKQFEESVLPEIQKVRTPREDAPDKLNDALREKLFENPAEAISLAINLHERAKKNISLQNAQKADSALAEFTNDESFKDVYPEAKKLSQQYLAQGHPPQIAAQLGFKDAKLAHLEGREGRSAQSMQSSGVRRQRDKVVKLPDALRKAYERDRSDGLVKDEKEWLSGMDQATLRRYGL